MLAVISIIIFVLITRSFSTCPPSSILSPCTCNDDAIACTGSNELDLLKIFKALDESGNQKHFKSFYLNNDYIKELKENTFRRITFDSIDINYCTNLTSIDRNAFGRTSLVTNAINIGFNHKLSSPDNSIWEAISKFVNATDIELSGNNIQVIPSNAFKPIIGNQDRLNTLSLQLDFKEIGQGAFYFLNSLTNLEITNTNINFLPMNVFTFEESSENVLYLNIYFNPFVDSYNISKNAFSSINRPTILRVDAGGMDHCIPYLDEHVFLPFLLKNNLNEIINSCPFNCDDCRNSWLKNDTLIKNRIRLLKCSNNKAINDNSNFKNCTPNLLD